MSLHIFGAVVTHHGTAANNRAETEGNVTTLQKLLWFGRTHSSVSAEAIRFALRRRLAEHEQTNRSWDESSSKPFNTWRDPSFDQWSKDKGFIDDDLLGFMSAEAAKDEAEDTESIDDSADKPKNRSRPKGTATIRRSPLEITRAISLSPYAGDVTFNAASPGATPSAQKGGRQSEYKDPVPYATELHATRYQYGFALTPDAVRKKDRIEHAIRSLCALGEVAGNHGRFLFDFSPESIVLRITQDPAPRLLYIFEEDPRDCKIIQAPALVARCESLDIPAEELIIGGGLSQTEQSKKLEKLGAKVVPGVREAANLACKRINDHLAKNSK